MAISDFNKSNPFVIIMRDRADDLTRTSVSMVKDYIISIICAIIIGVMGIFILKTSIVLLITIIFEVYNALILLKTLSSAELKRVDDIIYGNAYNVIDINNEELFSVIEDIDYVRGKMTYIITTCFGGILVSILIFLVLLFSHFSIGW